MKDEKNNQPTDDEIWSELDRIAFLGSIVGSIVLGLAYLFIRQLVNPGTALSELLLGIIANMIPVLIVFSFSYFFLRRLQKLRSRRDTDSLVQKITGDVIDTLQADVAKAETNLRAGISSVAEKLERILALLGEQQKPDAKIRILFVASAPRDCTPYDAANESRALGGALARSAHNDRFELIKEFSFHQSDWMTKLAQYKPTIIHIVAPGFNDAGCIFEDDSGHSDLVKPKDLAAIFKPFKNTVKLVVLSNNAVSTANELASLIDYVVVAQEILTDEAAIHFVEGFYLALAQNTEIAKAVQIGNTNIQLYSEATPSVYKLIAGMNYRFLREIA